MTAETYAHERIRLMLDQTARLWHYDHAVRPGSPCYNLPFSRCEGYQCASNRAALAGVEDSRTQEGTR